MIDEYAAAWRSPDAARAARLFAADARYTFDPFGDHRRTAIEAHWAHALDGRPVRQAAGS